MLEMLPVYIYEPETWISVLQQRKRIEAADMKLLRLGAGYTPQDHIRH